MFRMFTGRRTSETLPRYKEVLQNTIEDIEALRTRVKEHEQDIIENMKTLAEQRDSKESAKEMARRLINNRRNETELLMLRSRLETVLDDIKRLKSEGKLNSAMVQVAQYFKNLDKRLNMPEMQTVLNEFEKKVNLEYDYESSTESLPSKCSLLEEDDEEIEDIFNELGLYTSGNSLVKSNHSMPIHELTVSASTKFITEIKTDSDTEPDDK